MAEGKAPGLMVQEAVDAAQNVMKNVGSAVNELSSNAGATLNGLTTNSGSVLNDLSQNFGNAKQEIMKNAEVVIGEVSTRVGKVRMPALPKNLPKMSPIEFPQIELPPMQLPRFDLEQAALEKEERNKVRALFWRLVDARRLVCNRNGVVGSLCRGGHKALWHADGEVVNLATGAEIAKIEGVEFTEMLRPWHRVTVAEEQDAAALQTGKEETDGGASATSVLRASLVSRKLLVFKSPQDGSYMSEFRIRPRASAHQVDAMMIPYQQLDFEVTPAGKPDQDAAGTSNLYKLHVNVQFNERDTIRTVRHELPSSAQFGRSRQLRHFARFVQPARGSRGGEAASWERYDFIRTENLELMSVWTRVGACPSWYGRGRCAYTLRSAVVPRADSKRLPSALVAHLKEFHETYLRGVEGQKELEELQAGKMRLPVEYDSDPKHNKGAKNSGSRAIFKLG
uniref:Uncharacterized protein n=1 Tax=Erythrolobus madagascarensis TaxID=708628 RepID=A0A7S0XK06_9RHOD|mmetsp:Transcript_989/g.1930  ORF Transcript_989/g.1930 Transcript_989/m.1930 type:complete len:453 (+) Transcript_989:132-1490(+)|eukprot:CAMPEP_0185851886 /NCGR_PEP_ID=MMETSP1354-20130828/12189_1 /TAXON_ID=708628 /ORGANISM="Erythrolobus madagascarensis, Strain CCMP3276" /LENGTH=452 /DNA_ID=CAMNT_0028552989 /DNA_START=118 /DNA_END=1476 /DNA_ORIENTATION=-